MHVLDPHIGERAALDAVDARNANTAEIRQRRRRITAFGIEPAREDISILERLTRATPAFGSIACAASPISWMRPRPQLSVRGRVKRPHFEHWRQRCSAGRTQPAARWIGEQLSTHLVGIARGRNHGLSGNDPLCRYLPGSRYSRPRGHARIVGEEMAAGFENCWTHRPDGSSGQGGTSLPFKSARATPSVPCKWDCHPHRARGE